MATVQGRVRVLKDDLERTKLCGRALLVPIWKEFALEHRGARRRRNDAEESASERGLAGAGLSDEPERLAWPDRGAHVDERVHVVAALLEHLGQLRHLDEWRGGVVDLRQLDVRGLGARKITSTLVVPAAAPVPVCDGLEWRLLDVAALVGERAAIRVHATCDLDA